MLSLNNLIESDYSKNLNKENDPPANQLQRNNRKSLESDSKLYHLKTKICEDVIKSKGDPLPLSLSRVGKCSELDLTPFKTDQEFLISSFPKQKTIISFWEKVIKKSSLVVNLALGDMLAAPYCPEEIGLEKSMNLEEQSIKIILEKEKFEDNIKVSNFQIQVGGQRSISKNIQHIHYRDWEDEEAIPLNSLDLLVTKIESQRNKSDKIQAFVHSWLGKNRAMVLVTAVLLREAIYKPESEINKETLNTELEKLILILREQGRNFLQNKNQLELLFNYGHYLLERRSAQRKTPELPVSILQEIFKYIKDLDTFRSIILTCHRFHRIALTPIKDKLLLDPSIENSLPFKNVIKTNKIAMIELMIVDGRCDLSVEDNFAIKFACYFGNLNFFHKIMAHPGVDPSAQKSKALRNAITFKHEEIALELIKSGRIDPAICSNFPLEGACRLGQTAVVKALMETGKVNTTVKSLSKWYAFHSNNIEILKILLQDRANQWHPIGMEIMLSALRHHKIEVFNLLFNSGVGNNVLLLEMVCQYNHVEAVKTLIELRHTNPNSSLRIAYKLNNLEILKILLSSPHVDETVCQEIMKEALHQGYMQAYSLFIEFGFTLNN